MRPLLTTMLLAFAVGPTAAGEFDDRKRQFDYEPKQTLDVKESLLREKDGVKLYDVTYASPKGGRVTAYLVVPAAAGRHAGLVFGHWGPGNRTEFLPEAILYARAGAVCLLVDYPWVRPAPWRKKLRFAEDPEADHAAYVQAVVDLRRGLDLLAARADVDCKRLAYIGHNYGAQWGAILSAVENRLKGVVLIGGIPDQVSIYRDNDDPELIELPTNTPKDKLEKYFASAARTDAIHFVPYAATPLFFQFARFERYFNEAAMERYAKAAKEPKQVKWYDTGHELNDPQALRDRAAWLSDRVQLGSIELKVERNTKER